jgi:hypothetical protein
VACRRVRALEPLVRLETSPAETRVPDGSEHAIG